MTPLSHDEKIAEIERHEPMIRRISRKIVRMYRASDSIADDAAQSAMLYMWKALGRFDRDRGVQVITYCYPWIRVGAEREVQRHVRYLRRMDGEITCEELSRHEESVEPADEMVDFVFVEISIARWIEAVLSPVEKQTIAKRMQGKTLRDTGRDLSLTHERVRQIENTAHDRLRKALHRAEQAQGGAR